MIYDRVFVLKNLLREHPIGAADFLRYILGCTEMFVSVTFTDRCRAHETLSCAENSGFHLNKILTIL